MNDRNVRILCHSSKVIWLILFSVLLPAAIARADDNAPLKQIDIQGLPIWSAWYDLAASTGERGNEVSAEPIHADVIVLGEVKYVDKDGHESTMSFADGTPAKFTTGNYIARIQVRVRINGVTGAAVRVTQR